MKKHILIADTSEVSRYVLENYLSGKFNITFTSSIKETLEKVSSFSTEMIITSMNLEDGDAFKLGKKLLELDISIPLILLTEQLDSFSKFRCYQYGIIDFIKRDEIDETIAEKIEGILELYQSIDLSNSLIFAVDDSITQLKFIEKTLKNTNANYQLFTNSHDFLKAAEKNSPDICIIDVFLKETDGIDLTKKLRRHKHLANTRIIIQTTTRKSGIIRTLIVFGADDYLLKPYSPEELFLKIINNIKSKRIKDQLDEINQELFVKATTDPLTKLYNRRFLFEQLNLLIANYKRYLTPFAVLLIDLDNFKDINDTYGHDVGDDTLVHFAGILKASLRKTDIVGRFGGEEFLCLLPNVTYETIPSVISKILNSVRKYKIKTKDHEITFTISIGCCLFSDRFKDENDIIKCADKMLYMAKHQGKNRAYLKIDDKTIEIV